MKAILKITSLILAVLMISATFAACGGQGAQTETTAADATAAEATEESDSQTYEETTNPTAEDEFISPLKNLGVKRHATSVANDEADIKEPEQTGASDNLIPAEQSDFDSLTSLSGTNWSAPLGGKIQLGDGKSGKGLQFTQITQAWYSPFFNFRPYITESGDYIGSFDVMLKGDFSGNISSLFSVAIRGGSQTTSFMGKPDGVNVFVNLVTISEKYTAGEWYTVSFIFSVDESDLSINDTWSFCLHMIDTAVTEIVIDNLSISNYVISDQPVSIPTSTETWISTEMVLNSCVKRENPIMTTEIDIEISCNGTTLKVPGFWDGGITWKFRFALPFAGEWEYKTVCTDTSDSGLHGLTGKIVCNAYSGDLEIYKHGFLNIESGNKYFTYADGTPFIYLGDTHWTMYKEEFYGAGVNAGDIQTNSHFAYIVRKRVEQGFTVIQSEPVESGLDVTDGIDTSDVSKFQYMDNYFAYIAKHGLVHANALLMFPSDMVAWSKTANFDTELRAAVRYWVARYSSYPVLWTLGQETDKDFYGQFAGVTNPYVTMCELVNQFDPLHQEITAHQEHTDYTREKDSAFRTVEGHTWYGVQWNPELDKKLSLDPVKEYFESQKPAVLYEALYDHLWTDGYGARAQGWIGMLSGMCGYGYGAEDIWYYLSSYDIDTVTERNGITVTKEDKAVKWNESVEFDSAYQVGYMGDFLFGIEWWKLTPAFDNEEIFKPRSGCRAVCAYVDSDVFVIYSYDTSKRVGFVNALNPEYEYSFKWFNPRTGEYSDPTEIPAGTTSFEIPNKPTQEDWTVLVYRTK